MNIKNFLAFLALPILVACTTVPTLPSVGSDHIPTPYIYSIPFRDSVPHKVTQAPGGPIISHTGRQTINAVDFSVPEGTEVDAARDGTVFKVVDGFGEGKMKPAYMDRANYVFIKHEGKIFTMYGHLLRGTIKVKAGDHVVAGQPIGLSGNSGFSSGPHLHFAVLQQIGLEYYSIKFKMHTQQGDIMPFYHEVIANYK